MRWHEATLYQAAETGLDVMGVPQSEPAEAGTIIVRTAPKRPRRDQEQGNPHDYLERTFASPADPGQVSECQSLQVGGALYAIEAVADLESGGCLITCRRAKP